MDVVKRIFAARLATDSAGQKFRFKEDGSWCLGKIIGYYDIMAQVIMEVDFIPTYTIDPYSVVITRTSPLDKVATVWYTPVDPYDVFPAVPQNDPRYPHVCTRCGKPAFVFLCRLVECSNQRCACYKA